MTEKSNILKHWFLFTRDKRIFIFSSNELKSSNVNELGKICMHLILVFWFEPSFSCQNSSLNTKSCIRYHFGVRVSAFWAVLVVWSGKAAEDRYTLKLNFSFYIQTLVQPQF